MADPGEIWEKIVKADEALKYATDERRAVRTEQALRLLREALAQATAAGNSALEGQARTRLRDLGADDA